MKIKKLPSSWNQKQLCEVTKLITCGVAKRPEYVDSGIPFLSAKNVKNGKVIWNDYKFVSLKTHQELTKNNKPQKGDLLYTRVGSFGEAAIIEEDSEFSIFVSLTLIKTKPIILNTFLKYYLNSNEVKNFAKNNVSGSGVGNLNVGTVRKFLVPIPPLEEQKRIVGILDESFEAIALAEANTKKNLANARELFDSYRDKILYQESKEHIKTQLGKEIDLLSGFAFKSEFYTESVDDILLLRGDNIIQGKLRWDDAKRWKKSDLDLFSKFKLEENDIVLAMDRPWVNAGLKYSKITKKDLPCLLVQRVARLRSKKNLSNSFLFHLIGSKKFINHILRKQTGIGVPHISGKQIKDFSFLKPSINEQINIADSLDKIYLQLQKLEGIYQRKLEALAELKQSILQKAFTGQLTQGE